MPETSAKEYPDKRRIRMAKVAPPGPAVDTVQIVLYLGSSQWLAHSQSGRTIIITATRRAP